MLGLTILKVLTLGADDRDGRELFDSDGADEREYLLDRECFDSEADVLLRLYENDGLGDGGGLLLGSLLES